jgi:hypothetical protein
MSADGLKELMQQSIHEVQNTFSGAENTDDLILCVENIIPLPNTEYKILNVKGTATRFKASITCNLKNVDDLNGFITNYNVKNNETLRVSKSRNVTDQKSPYQIVRYFRCQHNTRYQPTMHPHAVLCEKPEKRFNTNCGFSLIARLSSKEGHNSVLDIEWNHNHPTDSLPALSFKDITADVIEKIKDLFLAG